MTTFVLLEVSLAAFIAIDHHWEKDLPMDPTGELHSLRTFIQQNMDVCKWIGIAIVVIQAFSLFLAIVLRTLVSSHRLNHDMERDYDVVGRTREPPLDPRISQTSGLAKGDARGGHSDIWSSRMREKEMVAFCGWISNMQRSRLLMFPSIFTCSFEDVKERGLAHIIEVTEEITLSCLVGSLRCLQVLYHLDGEARHHIPNQNQS